MSRAFVKERDDAPDVPFLELPAPSVATAASFRRLRERAAGAPAAARAGFERRIAAARLAEPPPDRGVVAFGATVSVRAGDGSERTFTITAEDDVDIVAGRIGPESPLALALLGARAGRRVIWRRPAGDERLQIVAVDYGEFV